MGGDRVPHFLLNWEIRNAKKKKERNHKRNEPRKRFYQRLLNTVVRNKNSSSSNTNSNKIVPLNYDDSNSNNDDMNQWSRVSVDSVEKLKAEVKLTLEVPEMSVDLQAAQLAKELQLGRNEIINLCNRSFHLYQRLDYIRGLSSKLNSRNGGVGCYGGHIARIMKSPGPHNGHRFIKEQDRLVTETSFQKVLNGNKKRPESRDNNNNNNNNNKSNKMLQPIWDHNFNKAMLLSPIKFHHNNSSSSNGKTTNSNNVEDIFKPLLKSDKHHHSNSKSSFVTNIDRPNTPTTYTNTNTNTHSTLSIISTPDVNDVNDDNDDNNDNDDNDIDMMINSPLKKSNSEVWLKLKKLWVSVSLELKHAGQDITYDDLLEISTMKECPPHMMHLLGYFLALLGKNADWPGICTFLFRNLQWWLQLIKSIDTSVCSISRCEKAHELKMMDPNMYPPICNMKISVPIFKIIRWVNAFDFLILIIMEINKDINSATTAKSNSKKKKTSKNNNVLQYFGIGPDDHLEMLNIFMEAEEDDKYCKNDEDNEDDNNNEQPSHQNIDTSNINSNRKNVTFDVVDNTTKTNQGNKISSSDDDYMDDDYNDDYENDETHNFEKDEARNDTNDEKIDDSDNAIAHANDTNATNANDTNANDTSANDTNANDTSANDTNVNDTSANDTNVNDTSANDTSANDTSANDTNANDTSANGVDGDIDHKIMLMDMLDNQAISDDDDKANICDVPKEDDDDSLLNLLDSLGIDDAFTTAVSTNPENDMNIKPDVTATKDTNYDSIIPIKATVVDTPHCVYCSVAKTHLHTFHHHPYIAVRYDNSIVYTCSSCNDSFWSFRKEAEETLGKFVVSDGERNEQICALCSDCPDDDLVLCSQCPRSFCNSCLSKLKNKDTMQIMYDGSSNDWTCMMCYNKQSSIAPLKNNENDIDNNYDDEFEF